MNIGSVLWRELFEPVHARLTAMGLHRGAPLVLMPSPGLAVLPLHAAWRSVQGHRSYAAEDYTITYCPSAWFLASSKTKLRSRQSVQPSLTKPLLVVADPTGDLPFAAIEGKAIAAACGSEQTELLLGPCASWTAVSQSFDNRVYLHFACHGVYNPTFPDRSFLDLAPPPERPNVTGNLRLLELFGGWNTDAARLVVLSACETAITDVTDASSDYMSLAIGWLGAGALGVIGSLWVLDDLCTMLLIERFYKHHLGTCDPSRSSAGLTPASALRAAQLYLKDLSNEEVCERLTTLEQLPGLSQAEIGWIAARRLGFSNQPASEQPFSEPYYWAGFTYTGA